MPPDGTSTYYSSDVTREDAASVQRFLDARGLMAYNTRLFKREDGALEVRTAASKPSPGGPGEPTPWEGRRVVVTAGDHAPLMARVVSALEKARGYAANDEQRAMLSKYVECFAAGSMAAHVDGSRH